MIEAKMAQLARPTWACIEMAIDGYVVKLDLPDCWEGWCPLLRYSPTTSISFARRVHEQRGAFITPLGYG